MSYRNRDLIRTGEHYIGDSLLIEGLLRAEGITSPDKATKRIVDIAEQFDDLIAQVKKDEILSKIYDYDSVNNRFVKKGEVNIDANNIVCPNSEWLLDNLIKQKFQFLSAGNQSPDKILQYYLSDQEEKLKTLYAILIGRKINGSDKVVIDMSGVNINEEERLLSQSFDFDEGDSKQISPNGFVDHRASSVDTGFVENNTK